MSGMTQALLMSSGSEKDPYFSSVYSLNSFRSWSSVYVPQDSVSGVTWTNSGTSVVQAAPGLYGLPYCALYGGGPTGLSTTLSRASTGSVAFTVEISVNFSGLYTSIPNQNRFLGLVQAGVGLTINALDNRLYFIGAGLAEYATSKIITLGTWYQIAVVANLTNVLVFVDGLLVLTQANNSGFPGGGSPVVYTPGQHEFNGDFWTGRFAETRLTVGVARYSGPYPIRTSPFSLS